MLAFSARLPRRARRINRPTRKNRTIARPVSNVVWLVASPLPAAVLRAMNNNAAATTSFDNDATLVSSGKTTLLGGKRIFSTAAKNVLMLSSTLSIKTILASLVGDPIYLPGVG